MKNQNIFDLEVNNRSDIMKPIWVNYFLSRKERENIAKEKWLELYEGNLRENSADHFWEELLGKCLDKFAPLTKDNKELTSKLIHDFFAAVKKDYPQGMYKSSQSINKLIDLFEKKKKSKETRKLAQHFQATLGNPQKLKKSIAKVHLKMKENGSLEDLESLRELYKKILALENFPLGIEECEDISETIKEIYKESQELEKEISSWSNLEKNLLGYFEEYYQKLEKVRKVFGDISILSGLGWDLSRSILSSRKWLALENIARLLENYEKLQNLVAMLGRLQEQKEFEVESILEVKKRRKKVLVSPLAKNELYGLHLSDDLQRLLPNELIQLGNPRLKKLFYARLIERRLMTYELRGVIPELGKTKRRVSNQKKVNQSKGPIILCIDTSGSMSGSPEVLAKAVAFLSLKIAVKEKRECYLMNFSGPGNVQELEIAQSTYALDNLLDFLMFSFGGGTDFVTPLQKAFAMIAKEKFNKADILMVTDGIGDIPKKLEKEIPQEQEKYNFRIFSLLVGNNCSAEGVSFSNKVFHLNHLTKSHLNTELLF